MHQPTLFDAGDALLADDERGRIACTPNLVRLQPGPGLSPFRGFRLFILAVKDE